MSNWWFDLLKYWKLIFEKRIAFWQKAEIDLIWRKGARELTPFILIITNRLNENEPVMYQFDRFSLFLKCPFF